jgi:hypothetical protein
MTDPVTEATLAPFARLALDCVTREYPNKIAHVLSSDGDVAPPRRLTPAFYGCFDWHSAVHGHWLLARVARLFPQADFAAEACAALAKNITAANIEAEIRYLGGAGRASFERPYGLAWLLALGAELRRSDLLPGGVLAPLEGLVKTRVAEWLPKLPRPDRSGQHANTAFAMGLMLDAARVESDPAFADLLVRRARDFYIGDRACALNWEPSGEDFLSPCLAEADLMRRVLPCEEFAPWAAAFLPAIAGFRPVRSPDQSDGKLAHLDGLNLSRAWMLDGVARALPAGGGLRAALAVLADAHAAAGLAAVSARNYEGSHWLGTFAVYLLTGT